MSEGIELLAAKTAALLATIIVPSWTFLLRKFEVWILFYLDIPSTPVRQVVVSVLAQDS